MKIVYLDVQSISDAAMVKSLVLEIHTWESDELKRRQLKRLGIEIRQGQSPLHAWLEHLCKINDLSFSIPIPRELAENLAQHSDVRQFMFWLA